MELRESIARATATAGGAVVFAGFTVMIALCSLAFAGIPLVTTLGFTAAVAVVVAVCAAATLLPAMLGALGPADQLPPRPPRQDPPRRQGAARLAALGGAGRRPALALDDRRAGRPRSSWRCRSSSSSSARTTSAPCPRTRPRARPTTGSNEGFGPGVNGPLLIASEFSSPEEAQQVLPGLQKAIGGAGDVAAVTEPTLDKTGHGRRLHRDLEIGAVGGRDRRPGRRPARRRRSPTALEGTKAQLLRRRPDRRLHRPRDADRRQAAADDRDRRRAQLHRPADRLPLAAGADQGGGDEPDLGRRRLRRRHRRLPARLGLVADRARPRDPDRQLRAAADVRDPLRALDGLRGLPADADAASTSTSTATRGARWSKGSPTPAA